MADELREERERKGGGARSTEGGKTLHWAPHCTFARAAGTKDDLSFYSKF